MQGNAFFRELRPATSGAPAKLWRDHCQQDQRGRAPGHPRPLTTSLLVSPSPCVYAGDFNCQHVQWGYWANNPTEWLSGQQIITLCCSTTQRVQPVSPPGAGTPEPIRTWPLLVPDQTTGSLTDVCLKSFLGLNIDPRSSLLQNSWPQYRVNQWSNGTSARLTGITIASSPKKATQSLTSSSTTNVEEACQDFCSALIKVAKRSIPRGHRNNYIPCWDKEYESLYRTFLDDSNGEESSSAATALLSHLDQRRCERWNEAIDSIDFSHFSRSAWEYPQ